MYTFFPSISCVQKYIPRNICVLVAHHISTFTRVQCGPLCVCVQEIPIKIVSSFISMDFCIWRFPPQVQFNFNLYLFAILYTSDKIKKNNFSHFFLGKELYKIVFKRSYIIGYKWSSGVCEIVAHM